MESGKMKIRHAKTSYRWETNRYIRKERKKIVCVGELEKERGNLKPCNKVKDGERVRKKRKREK
jgi:hypothetical protein